LVIHGIAGIRLVCPYVRQIG